MAEGERERPRRLVISLRASVEVRRRLDAHVGRLQRTAPGGRWSRSTAALNLLLRALDEVEEPGRD